MAFRSRKPSIFSDCRFLFDSAFTEGKSDAKFYARYVKGVPIVEKVYERGTFFLEKLYIKE